MCRAFRQSKIVAQSLRLPRQRNFARQSGGRGKYIGNRVFFERHRQNGNFAPKFAAVIAQQILQAARVFNDCNSVSFDNLPKFLTRRVVHTLIRRII
jgi:hypothetical protein